MKKFWLKQTDLSRTLDRLAGAIFLCGLILLIWFGAGYFSVLGNDGQNSDVVSTAEASDEPLPCPYRRLMDGVCVSSIDFTNPRLVAVMVENSRDAWPLSGLSQASIVYEAPVEGDIPRFLAIYQSDTDAEEVGPVRSARPYYLDWAEEYGNPVYMHVGGSDAALDSIHNRDILDINEMSRGWYFWRSSNRSAPHNTYTSHDLWQNAIDSYGQNYSAAEFAAWNFLENEPCTNDCISEVSVGFSNVPSYQVTWQYSTSTDQFERYQGGQRYAADTVIIQRVHAVTLDAVGRKRIDTIGSGGTVVFRNGQATQGTWQKTSPSDRTAWLDTLGNPIALQPGKIWIEIVPQSGYVSWE